MGHALTLSETVRIDALLARLDPDAGGTCRVVGCRHLHDEPADEELPALAA